METRDLEYRDASGKRYVGYLARPDRPSGPAVLVAHNAPGVADHERGVCRRLAELGYVALAADYVGDGEVIPGAEIMERLADYIGDPSLIRPVIRPALDALVAQPGVDAGRVAAIGYCFGGAASLELARDGADLKAVVGFHSGLPVNRPDDCKNIKGKVLILTGAADPMVPADLRNQFEAQMNAAGVDWTMTVYGGALHAFTVVGSENMGRPGIAYQKAADERSWRAMLDLFGESIGRP